MPELPTEDPADLQQVMAQVRRGFCDGLPARVRRMESALEELTEGYRFRLAETFYLAAHSLKGTAPSFGAQELADHAAGLADTGRGWLEAGAAAPEEVAAAAERVRRLRLAAERYLSAVEGSSPP